MLKFRPISYNEGDFLSFKYIGTNSIAEGQLCYIVKGSNSIAGPSCTLWKGTYNPTGGASLNDITDIVATQRRFFPIYKESPDVEDVNATIAKNTYVVGFFGKEWEVHKSVTESGYATSWAFGKRACLGSNGKWSVQGGKNDTSIVLAVCIGTYNSTWIRMRSVV